MLQNGLNFFFQTDSKVQKYWELSFQKPLKFKEFSKIL
jgi:hypothetical protein